MSAFICAVSFRDWLISRRLGIYGNKLGKTKDGVYTEFNSNIKNSIIRDLAGMREGDVVFFHVLNRPAGTFDVSLRSSVHGIYVVRQSPFYDTTQVWKDDSEVFPFRFLFEPHPHYLQLAKHDAFIAVEDFNELIERREIWSLATLENEKNLESRSVRKFDAISDPKPLIRALYRDFRFHHQPDPIAFEPISPPTSFIPIGKKITRLGQNENAIKALMMYKLAQQSSDLFNVFGSVSEFLNEVYIAQTTRKSIDILCFVKKPEIGRRYIICEAKKGECNIESLNQLLYYVDLFKRKSLVDPAQDTVAGCLVGGDISQDVIEFCQTLNAQGVNGMLTLLKYIPNASKTDATFERIL